MWLFYGSRQMPEDERPPIPLVPELEDPNWKAVYGDITFDCNHWSVFENAIDMAHIHYLHNDSFGNKDMPQIREMTCKAEAFHVNGDFVLHNKPVNALWEFSKVLSCSIFSKSPMVPILVVCLLLSCTEECIIAVIARLGTFIKPQKSQKS